jgi:hypothetical protein
MPVVGPAITAAIIAAGPELKGPDFIRLAAVVGTATATWATIPGNIVLTGVTTGALGAGQTFGKLTVVPVPLPVNFAMIGAGLFGVNAASVGRAVGMGVATALNASAAYQGVAVGVGVGADVSKVVFANPATLMGLISSTGAASGMAGPTMAQLSTALGIGISGILLTGFGVGSVTGGAGPSPAVGTSLSRVI